MKAEYRWIITKDRIAKRCGGKSAKGVEGPSNLDENIKSNRSHFVLKDDDGITYYEGDIYGEYTGFEPLDDFGEPYAGCTMIFYGGEQL